MESSENCSVLNKPVSKTAVSKLNMIKLEPECNKADQNVIVYEIGQNGLEKLAVETKESSASEEIVEEMTIEYDRDPDNLLPSVTNIKMEDRTTESKPAAKGIRRNTTRTCVNKIQRRSNRQSVTKVEEVSVRKRIRKRTKSVESEEKKALHICKICGKGWKRSCELKLHELVHTTEKSHKCGLCEKTFKYRGSLREHTKIHAGTRPQYKCSICNRTFMRKNALTRHMDIHEGSRPHKCRICKKSFLRKDTLEEHTITHADDNRPHKCRICKTTYSHKYNLKMHLLSNHSSAAEKTHKCPICDRTYFSASQLRKHKWSCHNKDRNKRKCKICGMWFKKLKEQSKNQS